MQSNRDGGRGSAGRPMPNMLALPVSSELYLIDIAVWMASE